jgi:hypothetical protein
MTISGLVSCPLMPDIIRLRTSGDTVSAMRKYFALVGVVTGKGNNLARPAA